MKRSLVILALLAFGASSALADEIRLRNGSSIHGRIVSENKEMVTIDLGRGRMSIPRRDILTITRTPFQPPEQSSPKDRKTRENDPPPQKAIPTRRAEPRTSAQTPRRRGTSRTPTGTQPRIVPVERTPPKPSRSPGPESEAPPPPQRSSSSRTAPVPSSKPDW
jgi:hypothetical protein